MVQLSKLINHQREVSMSEILLVGANRGIGLEMAMQLDARGDTVTVTCRGASKELLASGLKYIGSIDVTADAGIEALRAAIKGRRFDAVICVAGLLEDNTLDDLGPDSIRQQFEVNALGPLRVAEAVRHALSSGGKLALLTSRMGSIEDNGSGGRYGYRMSKAALNAAAKSLALDLEPEGIAVGILHPGYVRTAMTGFNGLLDVNESAELLIERIDQLNMSCSGVFFHAEGQVLPW